MFEYNDLSAGPGSTLLTLARVLEYSSRSVGVELLPADAALKIRQAAADSAGASPAEILTRAGEDSGLTVRVVRRSVLEAIEKAHEHGLWISLTGLDGDAVAVAGKAGRRIKVVRFDEPLAFDTLPQRDLVRAVGATDISDPVEWVLFESARPLTQFADEHGSHHESATHEHHGIPPFSRLKLLLRAERHDLVVAIIYSAAIGLLTLVVPVATQSLVNTVAFGTVLQPLVVLTLAVLVALGFGTVLQTLRAWVVELIQQRIFVRVSSDVVYRLVKVRADAFDRHHGPELVNRFLEVVTVQKAGSTLLVDGLSIFMQTLIGMSLLAVYHPWLLAFDAFLLIGMIVVLFGMARGAVRTSIRESRAKYSLVAWLEEIARNLLTFKSASGAAFALEKTDHLAGQYIIERNTHFRIVLRQIAGSLTLQAVASAVLLGVGGWLVINRQLTLGQLIAAEIVVGAVVSGLSKFGKQLEIFYDLQASLDKLGYLTDLPLERSGSEQLRRGAAPASVSLRDVAYSYGTRPVLRSVSLQIPSGARIGLTGKGGGGKSTIVDLLYALREPQRGTVEIDERDYRDLRLGDLRAQVAVIRENEIFEGTVADNVRLGNLSVTSGEIRDGLRKAGILDAVLALPEGINTKLATGGLPLSASQAMRLMMARAIVMKPRLLLIDEALDLIDDFDVQGRLCRSLFEQDAPWTLVVVTDHRGLLERCDEWYALHDGNLSRGGAAVPAAGRN